MAVPNAIPARVKPETRHIFIPGRLFQELPNFIHGTPRFERILRPEDDCAGVLPAMLGAPPKQCQRVASSHARSKRPGRFSRTSQFALDPQSIFPAGRFAGGISFRGGCSARERWTSPMKV